MNVSNYYYIVNGKAFPLWPSTSTRFVTPAKNCNMVHVGAKLARSTRLSIDSSVHREFLIIRGDSSKLEELANYPDIQNVRLAFMDNQGMEIILTNDILIRFKKRTSEEDRQALCNEYDIIPLERKKELWRLNILDPAMDAPLLLSNEIMQNDLVEYSEPNALQKARFLQVPSDPLFCDQWHLRNTGQNGGTAGADVDALRAWKLTKGSRNIRIVVHDTGVDIDHPDLSANITSGWDFDNNDSNASNDNNPHGTACAGVVAAVENNIGVVGIAPECRITPLRATIVHTWQRFAETFEWAVNNGEIITCSWSISPNNTLSYAIRDAANNGRNGLGTPIFFATGNDAPATSGISYPSSLEETIAVGASTNQDKRSDYSQFGSGIDFVAPSHGGTLRIETTDVAGQQGYSDDDYCDAQNEDTGFGGTSSATPLAAGVAALMLSINPNLKSEMVRNILRKCTDKIDLANANYNNNGWSSQYGYGRINAGKSVGLTAWFTTQLSFE